MNNLNINSVLREIQGFCRRWQIVELSLFGSVLQEDFNEASDLDVLVEFSPQADWSLLDHVQMEQELTEMVGRKVNLVSKRGIEQSRNPIRRERILSTAEVVFSA